MINWTNSLIEKLKVYETHLFLSTFTLLVSFRVWLITGIPKLLNYGPHDDLYFAKAAYYIIYRQWMGPYDQYTLIKAPFYSFFMTLSFFTGLPLFLNETIFYIGACVVLYFAFSPFIKNYWWRLWLFVYMLYAPASLTTWWNVRVYREFVYFSLTLYVVAFSIGLFLRLDQKISNLLLWSMGLGLSMGAFMVTREEGVWIYPILFLLLACCLLFVFVKRTESKVVRSLVILLPILLWQIPGVVVSYLNYTHYGYWGITEQLDPDFNRVLSTLARIKTNDPWHPAVRITKEVRIRAYQVSPLFNELKDLIEDLIPSWNVFDDDAMALKPEWYLKQYGNGGGDVGDGHFSWLLRDVVYTKGYYAGGKYPEEFYKQLAKQLETACNDGRLTCLPSQHIPFIGSIDSRHYPIILRMFFENVLHLLRQDFVAMVSMDVRTWPQSTEFNQGYKYFEQFIYNSIDHPEIRSDGTEKQYLVNGKLDIRIRMAMRKEKMMKAISFVYKWLSMITFLVTFFAWLIIMLPSFIQKRDEFLVQSLLISLFVLGLFSSRLLTLSIVDATTSAAGFLYTASCYIFIYLFSFLVLYWFFENKKMQY